jgi:hypothetical protein
VLLERRIKSLLSYGERSKESLPETLGDLPPKERLELLIKLLPFCLPKVDSIGGTYDTGWRDLGDED